MREMKRKRSYVVSCMVGGFRWKELKGKVLCKVIIVNNICRCRRRGIQADGEWGMLASSEVKGGNRLMIMMIIFIYLSRLFTLLTY